MDLPTRSCKISEIWKQLNWLEKEAAKTSASGPHLLGEQMTLADFTWFPTCVFMEFMLPRVFGWPELFLPGEATPFPTLAAWYTHLKATPAFAAVHADIWGYWESMEAAGQFQPILDELAANTDPSLKFTYGRPQE